jgi:hypothetical protein
MPNWLVRFDEPLISVLGWAGIFCLTSTAYFSKFVWQRMNLISLCTKLSASQNYSDGKEGRAGLRLNLVGQTGPRRRHPRQCKGLQKSSPSGGAFIRLSKSTTGGWSGLWIQESNMENVTAKFRQRSLHFKLFGKRSISLKPWELAELAKSHSVHRKRSFDKVNCSLNKLDKRSVCQTFVVKRFYICRSTQA